MRIAFAVLLLAVVGCSGGNTTPPKECTSTSCGGCCDTLQDACKAGTVNTYCGKDGVECIRCPTGQMCEASSGRCVQTVPCNRTSGTGCMTGNCKGTDGLCYGCMNMSAFCTSTSMGCTGCGSGTNGVFCCTGP